MYFPPKAFDISRSRRYKVPHEYVNIWIILKQLMHCQPTIQLSFLFWSAKKKKCRFKGGILTILLNFSMGVHTYTNLKKRREMSTYLAKSSDAYFPPSCLSPLQRLTQVTSPSVLKHCLHPFAALWTWQLLLSVLCSCSFSLLNIEMFQNSILSSHYP